LLFRRVFGNSDMQKNGTNLPDDISKTQGTHLRDYLLVLKKRKATLFTFFLITFLLVTIATFSMTPLYTASSRVLIEKNLGDNSMENSISYSRYDPEFLGTQFKIITSSNVIKRVISQLQLDTKYRGYFLKEEKNRFLFLKSVKQKINDLFESFSSHESKLLGDEIEGAGPLAKAEPVSDLQLIIEKIKDDLEIKPERDTKIVKIMYSHRHSNMAKLITEQLIIAYKKELQEIKHSSSSDTLKWMTEKAEEERKKLEDTELALQEYTRKNDIITIENKLAIYPQKLSEFSSQLSTIQAERKKLESVYSQIKVAKENSWDVETIPVFADNPVLQNIRSKIYAAKQNIKQLLKTYGYKNPVIIKAKEELNSLKKEKKLEIQRVTESSRNAYDLSVSQEKNITELLNTTKNDLLNLNEKYIQYSIMQREVKTNSILYDTLTASLKKASVTKQSQNVNVWVIKEASSPQKPSKPNKVINLLLGIILGFLGGIGLVFFVEYIDNTIRSPAEIEQRFGLTVLGAIEDLRKKDQKAESLVLQEPLSPFAESYRLIRSSILFSAADHPPRRILFTSMAPSEGKTVTTVNIARILSQSGKKVVIVDCDMRKPRQHTLFSIPNSVGLSSYLTGNTTENIVHPVEDEKIFLINAGPISANPAELVSSAKMKLLMEELMTVFDFILLDSPPIQSVTDSLTLSTLVDGTIVVVRAGKTTYDIIADGLGKLKAINAHVLGFVLNRVGKATGSEGYYHGYYQYYAKDES